MNREQDDGTDNDIDFRDQDASTKRRAEPFVSGAGDASGCQLPGVPLSSEPKRTLSPVFEWNWPRFSLCNVTLHGNFQTVA